MTLALVAVTIMVAIGAALSWGGGARGQDVGASASALSLATAVRDLDLAEAAHHAETGSYLTGDDVVGRLVAEGHLRADVTFEGALDPITVTVTSPDDRAPVYDVWLMPRWARANCVHVAEVAREVRPGGVCEVVLDASASDGQSVRARFGGRAD